MHEKCLKNAQKTLDLKIRVFSGGFSNPTLCHSRRERGLFRKVNFLEILENSEILESRDFVENPQTVENKGETDHFLEILENVEIFRDSRDSSSEKTPFVMTPFSAERI